MKRINIVLCALLCMLSLRPFAQTKDTLVENGCKYVSHEVLKGQTLYGLSKQYKVTIERLIEDNPGTENGIQIGQQLKIYAGKAVTEQVHVVQQGESLYKISKKYGVSIQNLLDWNPGLTERIDIGQKIKIRKAAGGNEPQTAKEEAVRKPADAASVEVKSSTAKPAETEPAESRPSVRRDVMTERPMESAEPVQASERVETTVTPQAELSYTDSRRGEQKQEYNVFLLVPLYTQDSENEEMFKVEDLEDYERIKSFDFIQFYQAALLAVEDLNRTDVRVNFYVKDVNEKNNAELGRWIASGLFADADLVIGPFFRENFRTMMAYAENHHITVVNPFTVTAVETSCPLFRVMASYYAQAANLAEYVRQHYAKAQLLLLNNGGSDSKRISAFKSSLMKSLQDYPGLTVKEVNYKSGGVSAVKASLNPTCENFVVAFFDGEITVTNFIQSMNRLNVENVTLVTSSDWRRYDKIETEYYARLKTHYIDQFFVDYADPKVIEFIERFREKYDIEPTLEHFAFQGYDITRYFLGALMNYGSGFGLEVNQSQQTPLSTQFRYAKGKSSIYENTFCHIYKLKDYRYIDAWQDDELTTPVICPEKTKKRR